MADHLWIDGSVYGMAGGALAAQPADGMLIDLESRTVVSVGRPPGLPDGIGEIKLPPGAVVLPGLHDRHTHWMFALFADAVVLNGVADIDEAERRIKAQLARQIEGWIVATGWNTGLLGPMYLSQGRLDDIVRGRKAIVFDQSFHSAVISTALAREIVPRFPREAVGSYRDGFLKHQYVVLAMAWMELDQGVLKPALLKRQMTMLSAGFTRMTDMGITGFPLLHALQDLYRLGWLVIPCEFALQPWMLREDPRLSVATAGMGPSFQLRWMKEFADGAFGNRLASLCTHHRYRDDETGQVFLNEKRYVGDVLLARERGIDRFAIHCIGCNACEAAATMFGAVMQRLNSHAHGCTFSFEHFETVHPALVAHVARLQKAGVQIQVCSQPGFLTDLTDYTDRLPTEVMAMINPYGTFRREGLLWVAGTDGAITGDDPWGGMSLAVNRGGPQSISVPEILGTFIDSPLVVGAQATFLVVDRDPFARPEELGQVRVLETWINGRKVYTRGAA